MRRKGVVLVSAFLLFFISIGACQPGPPPTPIFQPTPQPSPPRHFHLMAHGEMSLWSNFDRWLEFCRDPGAVFQTGFRSDVVEITVGGSKAAPRARCCFYFVDFANYTGVNQETLSLVTSTDGRNLVGEESSRPPRQEPAHRR